MAGNEKSKSSKNMERKSIYSAWERYDDEIRIHNYMIDEAETRKLSF